MGWLLAPTLYMSDGEETTWPSVQWLETRSSLWTSGLGDGFSSLAWPLFFFPSLILVESALLDLPVQLREAPFWVCAAVCTVINLLHAGGFIIQFWGHAAAAAVSAMGSQETGEERKDRKGGQEKGMKNTEGEGHREREVRRKKKEMKKEVTQRKEHLQLIGRGKGNLSSLSLHLDSPWSFKCVPDTVSRSSTIILRWGERKSHTIFGILSSFARRVCISKSDQKISNQKRWMTAHI